MFPIFYRENLAAVAEAYGKPPEYVWTMSYKTLDRFRESLEKNIVAIKSADDGVRISSFRSPCMVPTWVENVEYLEVLESVGVNVDSSLRQELTSNLSKLKNVYAINGITEVPATRSNDILDAPPWKIIEKMHKNKIPTVFFFHPKNFSEEDVGRLDSLLDAIEGEYDVRYATIAEIAENFVRFSGSA
jgi:hypothetical protein